MTIGYKWIRWIGYLCLVLSAMNTTLDHYGRWAKGQPYNPGIGMGIEAIALVGIVAVVVAECVKKLEARLPPEKKLESR